MSNARLEFDQIALAIVARVEDDFERTEFINRIDCGIPQDREELTDTDLDAMRWHACRYLARRLNNLPMGKTPV